MSKYCFKINATSVNNMKKIEDSIENFKSQIILLSITQAQTDQVFKLVESLIDTYSETIIAVVSPNETKLIENIGVFQRLLKVTLENHNAAHKRKKQIEKNNSFVPSVEKAIGFKWIQRFDETTGNIVRKYQQNTFQFISPSSIIQALLSNPDFVKMYLEHVKNKEHECTENVYRDYCCGSNFSQSEFLRNNPTAMQLQLYTDDFEPCDALKSKAGKHKKCAFYMTIRNMPRKFQAKLSNIFLIALADSIDLKSESASFENIIEVILEDLKMLETVGINIPDDQPIKACLTNMCFDNLGGNICYGLPEGFQANHFCRFCLCHKSDCRILTKEDPEKLRDIESYNEICARILEEKNMDLTETKGIKRYCKLNDLDNFHIFSNYTVDPMHDLLEGAVPFALNIIFEYSLEKKVFSLSQLQNMIQFYNYGYLNKRNIPSKLKIESKNLGQNATQLYCLITNIPFILFQHKNKLKPIWTLVQSLLQILEIVFSDEIHESDLHRLESEIECHTKFIVNVLKKNLIPKHHLLLHYPRVIRTMGPVIYMSAMRLEAKHQELKAIAQKTNNFVNLNKTIAEKHQMSMCLKGNKYYDEIEPGKELMIFEESDNFENYKSCTALEFEGNKILIKSLKVNNSVFKSGLLLLYESNFFEINSILRSSENYFFLCDNSFYVQNRDLFCNSLIIQENSSMFYVLNLNQIKNKKRYQKVYMQGKIHIICDTLDLSQLCPI